MEKTKTLADKIHAGRGYDALVKELLLINPIYYDPHRLWWAWDEKQKIWYNCDECHIKVIIKEKIPLYNDDLVRKGAAIIEACQIISRKNAPLPFPQHWIQYKNAIIDINNGEQHQPSPKYFCVNVIPWNVSEKDDTPTLDKLFSQWVAQEYVRTLYEIIAYCTYSKYPLHFIFALIGGGRNGKSTFLRILEKFIGKNNCATAVLKQLVLNKNESFGLYQKLVCIIPETTHQNIEDNVMLKQLTGEDLIKYEKKYADGFTGVNYAKIIMASNRV